MKAYVVVEWNDGGVIVHEEAFTTPGQANLLRQNIVRERMEQNGIEEDISLDDALAELGIDLEIQEISVSESFFEEGK